MEQSKYFTFGKAHPANLDHPSHRYHIIRGNISRHCPFVLTFHSLPCASMAQIVVQRCIDYFRPGYSRLCYSSSFPASCFWQRDLCAGRRIISCDNRTLCICTQSVIPWRSHCPRRVDVPSSFRDPCNYINPDDHPFYFGCKM